jgi:hypothetical protein
MTLEQIEHYLKYFEKRKIRERKNNIKQIKICIHLNFGFYNI